MLKRPRISWKCVRWRTTQEGVAMTQGWTEQLWPWGGNSRERESLACWVLLGRKPMPLAPHYQKFPAIPGHHFSMSLGSRLRIYPMAFAWRLCNAAVRRFSYSRAWSLWLLKFGIPAPLCHRCFQQEQKQPLAGSRNQWWNSSNSWWMSWMLLRIRLVPETKVPQLSTIPFEIRPEFGTERVWSAMGSKEQELECRILLMKGYTEILGPDAGLEGNLS